MNGIRLQLMLAKAGVASRRHAEHLITAGDVAVNGKVVTQLGTRVDPVHDQVTVKGAPVQAEAAAYFLLNKPAGYVTTAADPEGRETVFSLLPNQGAGVRVFSVGRLDYNTEGVLLLTNDGELAHALMHPSKGVPKVYHAKFRGQVTREQLAHLREGVELPPVKLVQPHSRPQPTPKAVPERSAPAQVEVIGETGRHTWLEVTLHEGKNRQIHRMAEAVGSSLLKLQRVRYANLTFSGLKLGEARRLTQAEVNELRRSVGLGPRALPHPHPALSRKRERVRSAQEALSRPSKPRATPRVLGRPSFQPLDARPSRPTKRPSPSRPSRPRH